MPNDNSKIDQLKRSLYSRDGKVFDVSRRHRLRTENINAPASWEEDSKLPPIEVVETPSFSRNEDITSNTKPSSSFALKFLLIAMAFFIVAVGVLGYKFFYNSNVVSANNIDINILGPISIAAGDELSY